jgi:hypothetical protein
LDLSFNVSEVELHGSVAKVWQITSRTPRARGHCNTVSVPHRLLTTLCRACRVRSGQWPAELVFSRGTASRRHHGKPLVAELCRSEYLPASDFVGDRVSGSRYMLGFACWMKAARSLCGTTCAQAEQGDCAHAVDDAGAAAFAGCRVCTALHDPSPLKASTPCGAKLCRIAQPVISNHYENDDLLIRLLVSVSMSRSTYS